VRKEAHPEPLRVHSAGGVVVKGSGPDLRVALMRSGHGTWVLPKGRIEEGETPAEAALREVGEEIGLPGATLIGEVGQTEHEYDRAGKRHRKQVDWFLLRADPEAELFPNPDENALDCGWFTGEQALSLLSHPDQRRIVRRALASWR